MDKQKVYLSRSQAGMPGLFTGRLMASSLTEAEYADIEKVKAKCRRMGFELVSKEEGIKDV